MRRWSSVLVAAAIVVPSVAQAQRPSNNMHTRSADTYLAQAEREQVLADKRVALEKALEAALAGSKADPNNPRVWFLAGRAYAGLNNIAAADSMFDRAEELYPEYGPEIEPMRLNAWIDAYNAGVTALQSNDLANAVRSLETADRIYRKRPEALVTLGSLYAQTGETEKAQATFQAALEVLRGPERAKLRPDQAKTWEEDELTVAMRLANIYVDQSKFNEAEQVYADLLKAQPNNTAAKANLAVTMSRAGKTAESAALYRELLTAPDVSEATLFNVGIGLYRANDFAQSAAAFRRGLEQNPVSHDLLYNLGQALFSYAGELEKERGTAAEPRKAQIATELKAINEEMRTTSEKIQALDPTNRNVLMMLAHSQRTMAELSTGAESDTWRRAALATLEKHKALKFEVADLTVVPGETQTTITGKVTNLTAAAGTPLTFRLIIIDKDGAELVTETVTVTAPATQESERFTATFATPENAAGWKYVID
jgi:tetratricopeptide (TPR) repeat protein